MSTLSSEAAKSLRLLEGRKFDEKEMVIWLEQRIAALRNNPDREVQQAVFELGNLRTEIMRGKFHAGESKSVFR
ncbi:MAG: hypothetical protein Alpg2KO_27630 [Alphaproteobacteria bacterium]